jgi:hypothetical protein
LPPGSGLSPGSGGGFRVVFDQITFDVFQLLGWRGWREDEATVETFSQPGGHPGETCRAGSMWFGCDISALPFFAAL